MKKKKILFFHFDLGNGGAEKVLVNLANNLNPDKYDITVMTLFNYGVNRKYLKPHIKFKSCFNCSPFRGISPLLQIFSPSVLHKILIREKYDIEISFREGCTNRIISGCRNASTKTFGWIHISMGERNKFIQGYRSLSEAIKCHNKLSKTAVVSDFARESLKQYIDDRKVTTVNNVVEREKILNLSKEHIPFDLNPNILNLCSVGRLTAQKSYDRLLNALASLLGKGVYNWHFYLLGQGEQKNLLINMVNKLGLDRYVTFLGYDENPYKFVAKMDLFICSSLYEGYSTAVTESIIVGTPVLTTQCSGMDEIFGDTNSGKIVENSQNALTEGLYNLLSNPNELTQMREAAAFRSEYFSEQRALLQFEEFINCD